MSIDKRVRDIKGDIDNDQAGQIAKSLLNSLEEVPPKLVVLPKHHDLALRMEGLDDCESERHPACYLHLYAFSAPFFFGTARLEAASLLT
jgi:hypothetical protein